MIPSGNLTIDLANDRLADLRRTAAKVREARKARAARSPRRTARAARQAASRRHAHVATEQPSAGSPPGPHTEQFADWASELAERVAADGIDDHRFAVNAVARLAARAGVNAPVTAALGDPAESAALRERALGYALVALASAPVSGAQRPHRAA